MQLFRAWVTLLGFFEFLPLWQLANGMRVTEMAPAFYPEQQSDEFHIFYAWFLISATVCRLTLASNMKNKGVFAINIVLHAVEAIFFTHLFKKRILHRINAGEFPKNKAVTESTIIYGIILLNALLFPARYSSYTNAKVKAA
eukprot:Hpha_TRINITY_DN8916_c0_g1::TRINITY_DN8916_c0_g1_i1::g.81013::m.81013